MKTGTGLSGKSVNSLKSLYVILYLFVRICCTLGWHLRNWIHNGVGLLLKRVFLLGTNIAFLLACFMFEIVLRMYLLYTLRIKRFISLLLYFLHIIGDVVLRITLVISPMAIPLKM